MVSTSYGSAYSISRPRHTCSFRRAFSQIMIDIDPELWQARESRQVMYSTHCNHPTSSSCRYCTNGQQRYNVDLNSSPQSIKQFESIPNQGGKWTGNIDRGYSQSIIQLCRADQYRTSRPETGSISDHIKESWRIDAGSSGEAAKKMIPVIKETATGRT